MVARLPIELVKLLVGKGAVRCSGVDVAAESARVAMLAELLDSPAVEQLVVEALVLR